MPLQILDTHQLILTTEGAEGIDSDILALGPMRLQESLGVQNLTGRLSGGLLQILDDGFQEARRLPAGHGPVIEGQ